MYVSLPFSKGLVMLNTGNTYTCWPSHTLYGDPWVYHVHDGAVALLINAWICCFCSCWVMLARNTVHMGCVAVSVSVPERRWTSRDMVGIHHATYEARDETQPPGWRVRWLHGRVTDAAHDEPHDAWAYADWYGATCSANVEPSGACT
jgi:hypothetical protein